MREFGILKKYPNVRTLISGRVADLAMLCRPLTFFGAFVGGMALDIMFSRLQYGIFDIYHAFFIGFIMAFFQAGGQAFNQSIKEEVLIDRLNGKDYRPTVSGRISLFQAKIIAALFLGTAILFSFTLFFWCGILSLVMVFFAVFYTARPLRIKRFFILNNIWQGIARGFFPPLFVSILYPEFLVLALSFGLFFGIWVSFAQSTKDFGDVHGDRQYGIRTLPVVLGYRLSIFIMLIGVFYSFFTLNWMIYFSLLPVSFTWLNILAIPSGLILVFLRQGTKVHFTENNLAWVFFYITLASFYMIPAIVV